MKVREILKSTIYNTSIFLSILSLSRLSVAQEYTALEETSFIENTVCMQTEISLREFHPIVYYLPIVNRKSVKMKEEIKNDQRKISLKDVVLDKKTLIALADRLGTQNDLNEVEMTNCQFTKGKKKEDSSQVLVHSECLNNIQVLRLEYVNLTDERLQFIKRCPKIKSLHLIPFRNYTMHEGMGISKELLSDLSFLKDTLKELSLRYLAIRKEHIKAIANFTHLEALDLRGNQLEDSDIVPIQNLYLKSLDVSDNMLTERAFCSEDNSLEIREAACCETSSHRAVTKEAYNKCPNFVPTLTKLDVSNNKFYGNSKSFYGLILFRNLNELNVSNNDVYSLDASLIAQLPLASLKVANISGNPIAILIALPRLMKENLRELDVTGYNPQPEDFNFFRGLKNIETLAVNLPEEKQTELVQELGELPYLKNLTLCNSLKEQHAVSSLGKFPSLNTLNIRTHDSEIIEEFAYVSLPALENIYLAVEGKMSNKMIKALGGLGEAREIPNLNTMMVAGNFNNTKEKEKVSKCLNKNKKNNLNVKVVKGTENYAVFQEYFFV